MKLLLISPFPTLVAVIMMELIMAAEVPEGVRESSQQNNTLFNFVNDLELPEEPSEDLKPPTSPVFQYSNIAKPEWYPAGSEVPRDTSSDQSEDMETAGTVTIGRHSGRYFGPGLWLGYPSFNRYRNHYHYRPSYSYYPRRYPNRHHNNPGLWIGG